MKKWLLIIIFILNFNLLFSGNTEKIVLIKDNYKSLNLSKYTYLYSTLDTSSNINNILHENFTYTPDGLSIGLNDKIWWEKIRFNNPYPQEKEFYIFFPYSHINKIIAYQEYNGKIKHIASVGTYYGYKDIDIYGHPFLVQLHPGINTIYIYINHLYLPLRGLSFLISKQELALSNMKNSHTIWFWRGFFVFAIFLTLMLFFATKLKIFLYYFILNIGVGLFFITEIGDISKLLSTDPYNLTIDIKHLGNLIILFFFPLVINKITSIQKTNHKLWKALFYIIYPMVILWIICLIPSVKHTHFLYISTYYIIILSGIVFVAQLYFIFMSYLAKQRNSGILLFVYSLYVFLVFTSVILPNLGILKNNLQVYNSLIYGSIIEIIMLMGLIGKETFSIYQQRTDLLEIQKNNQTEIIKAIVKNQEKERNKVGQELHDTIGANISIIKQQIDKNNPSLTNIINRTLDEIRNLSYGLISSINKEDNFINEINDLCLMASNLNLKAEAYFHNWIKIEDPTKTSHLHRIIQELLQNTIKHSKAKDVLIQFIVNEHNKLTIMYEDNGIGLNYNSLYEDKDSDFINIENRVELMGGSILYDTQKGNGTTIIITIDI